MARRIESHSLAGPAGNLEALLEEPDHREPRMVAVLCHPHPLYGGTMHNKVVYRMAHGLRRSGIVVLRFNFRGVGASQGKHGHLEGEIEDARSALAWLRARYPDFPYALAGFSFGSRVITRLGCENSGESGGEAQGADFLMAAGFPTRWGSPDYLNRCSPRKIFIQSTNDQYGPRAELEEMYQRFAAPKELHWIEAADHFFAGGLEALEEQVMLAADIK